MSVVRTENLVKDYALNGIVVNALRGVGLSFEAGEFAAVAGPSGSGKSTFLHLVGCLDVPTSGSVTVGGRDTALMRRADLALLRRQTIGFIFQAYNLIPVLSAIENVSVPLVLLGEGAREARERSLAMLDSVGLAGMEDRRPKEMSGGQQQRVAIARALVKRPSLILADEPTGNLDPESSEQILFLLQELNRAGKTIVMATHDYALIAGHKRRTLICENRRVADVSAAGEQLDFGVIF